MYGTSNYQVERVNFSNGKNVKFTALLNIPRAKSESTYVLEWKLGILNIKGSGKTMTLFGEKIILFQVELIMLFDLIFQKI